MPIESQDVAPLLLLLSPERLGALTQLTGSASTAIELHQQTLRLGGSLMHVTATMEIALRNSVCENLTAYFGVPDWLTRPPIAFRWREPELTKVRAAVDSARRAQYSKLSQTEKGALDASTYPHGRPPNTSHLQRAKDRRRKLVVTEGKVVAELTLYFWKRLFGPDYEQTLWRTTLKKTFPNKGLSRAAVAVQLEHLYQARNRLAHHEPVLHQRFRDAVGAINFITQNLGMWKPEPNSPLANLVAEDMAKIALESENLHARLDAFRLHAST